MKIACPNCKVENGPDSRFCRNCATPLAPSVPDGAGPTVSAERSRAELATGQTFARRYRIIEELGQGGMGRVYKAFDTKLGEKIALKLVRPDIASDRTVLERFANEIRLARRITHRNVCRMHDLGDEGGAAFITMEYVSGEDLGSMLRMTGGLSPAQTVAIGRQIAAGLAEAHRLGVVHRDLKPHNVMIDREGAARIMDFGIAHSSRTKGLTDHGVMIGTPAYMSPEQAEGEEVDPRSDIYSLGVMLFEMATGRLPFEGRTPLAVAMKHKSDPAPDPSAVSPLVPVELSQVILKCLEKDRTARFQSADALREALDRLGSALPAATPALPLKQATTDAARPAAIWWRVAISAGVVLATVLTVAGWLVFSRDTPATSGSTARAANSLVVIGFENQTGDPRYDHLRKAIPSLIITSLENTGRFKVTTWERMKDVLRQAGRTDIDVIDAEGGFDVCSREGVAFVVTGSFTKAGDTFATDVKVLDAVSRSLVKSVTSRGDGENSILLTQIDAISRGILEGLQPVEAAAAVTNVVDVTTRSMEAYAAYLRGREAYERFYHENAATELRRAVDIDPAFASAHLYLALSYHNLADRIARNRELKAAKAHAASATERERLAIEARYALFIEGDATRTTALFKELAARYPQDKVAHYELGQRYSALKLLDEAVASFRRALDLDPDYGPALNSLAFAYFNQHKPDLAIQYLERYAAANPADANPIDSLGDIQWRLGRVDDATATYKRAVALRPEFGCQLQLSTLAALREDYDDAFRWIDNLIAQVPGPTSQAEGRLVKAMLFQLTGRARAARDEVEAARRLLDKTGSRYITYAASAWLEYDNGNWARSRSHFQKFRDEWQEASANPAAARMYYLAADGLIARAEGNKARSREAGEQAGRLRTSAPLGITRLILLAETRLQAALLASDGKLDEAIERLRSEWPGEPGGWFTNHVVLYHAPLVQDDLAQLYVQKKDWDHAIAEYKVLTAIGPEHKNRRFVHPIYHYRLAKVYENKGLTKDAVNEYERFLTLWAKADVHRPETGDARLRLAALR